MRMAIARQIRVRNIEIIFFEKKLFKGRSASILGTSASSGYELVHAQRAPQQLDWLTT